MGSEGYSDQPVNRRRTNHRTGRGGAAPTRTGSVPGRDRASGPRAVGQTSSSVFRLSMLDLVEGGSSLTRSSKERPGARGCRRHHLNTGIGWHEARIPTIATSVPRRVCLGHEQMKGKVKIPLVTTNRINTPRWPSRCWRRVRPTWCRWRVRSSPTPSSSSGGGRTGRPRSTPVSAANQACLDHTFQLQLTSCLVNPRACHETEIHRTDRRTASDRRGRCRPRRLAGGRRPRATGHATTLFEADDASAASSIAAQIPGEEFSETLRYRYQRSGGCGRHRAEHPACGRDLIW